MDLSRLERLTKPVRISFNMFCCATLFCWAGVQPRETISGLFGRKARHTSQFWIVGERLIDRMHPKEPGHCWSTAAAERLARLSLGYER